MEKRGQLKFNEAAELICGQYQIGAGEAHALVWRAIASREVQCAWTEGAIIDQERQAVAAISNNFDVRNFSQR